MLDLDAPDRQLPRSLLEAPGGFAWWYADIFDDAGNGMVCIWSFGLPFLPGYYAAHREGRAAAAGARPSINLALYRDGLPASYHLVELDPSEVDWGERAWNFGTSKLRYQVSEGEARLVAELDLPVTGSASRLTGDFQLTGPAMHTRDAPAANPVHAWTPLMGPARATWRFRHGDAVITDGAGSGYHDRNGSVRPMDRLGLDHWIWSRQVLGDVLTITYLNFPDDPGVAPFHVVVTVDRAGRLEVHEDLRLELSGRRRGCFGMPWWRHARIVGLDEPLELSFSPPFDDGPFYLRAWTRAHQGGQAARGIAELCRPARIDRAWSRPLVRMVVQRDGGRQSMWNPLFAGPRTTALQRLLRHWRTP